MIIIVSKKKRELPLPRADLTAVWLFSLFMLGYFLKSPSLAAGSATRALHICASGLIPSLFPFIVLVSIMNASGMSRSISALIGKPLGWLFGISSPAAYAIVLGALGGFPIGAVCARELYERGDISLEEAERLCAFTNNAGPAYCIGGIGTVLFQDTAFGVRLYLCQLAAAFVIGIAQRKRAYIKVNPSTIKAERLPIAEIFTRAITQGGQTMLKICSFAVFFAIIGDAACMITDRFFGEVGSAIIASLCELTLAGRRCAALEGALSEILCAFAVGYAGMSVHMQVTSILTGSGIRLTRYHICKFIEGILCAFFMYLTMRL